MSEAAAVPQTFNEPPFEAVLDSHPDPVTFLEAVIYWRKQPLETIECTYTITLA